MADDAYYECCRDIRKRGEDKMLTEEDYKYSKPRQQTADAFGIGIVLIIFSWAAIPGFQIYRWLRDGYWLPFEFRLVWQWLGGSEPSFAWLGFQKIAVAILDAPLSVAIMIAILPVPFLLGVIVPPIKAFFDRYMGGLADPRVVVAIGAVTMAIVAIFFVLVVVGLIRAPDNCFQLPSGERLCDEASKSHWILHGGLNPLTGKPEFDK